MHILYRKGGIIIPKKYQYESFYLKIKDFLTRRTKKYNTSDYITSTFFLESIDGLLIPRFFPLDEFIKQYEIKDSGNIYEKISISHNISLRNETQKEAAKYMLDNLNGILQLSPGVGKTVIAIFVISERKSKSLILVHRDSLVDQWIERVLQFTNLTTNNIAKLTSATFKEDLKKEIIVSTVQTFVSLLKRNRKEFLIEIEKSNIETLIADEVHTSVGAPIFSECSLHIPAIYIYGLSATPNRQDGNGDIIKFHLGEIFSKDNVDGTMDVDVTILFLDYKIDTGKRSKYLYWGGDFQRSRYLNLMRKSKNFIDISKALLNKLKKNRDLIYVCERIKIIEDLFDWLDFESKEKFIGSAKKDVLVNKVIFSTPGKIRDGVDIPSKDALIMTSPISNIEQLSGRINRICTGKQTPIIVDMVDIGCKRISQTIKKRIKFYKDRDWNIKFLFADSDRKIIEIPEATIEKIMEVKSK